MSLTIARIEPGRSGSRARVLVLDDGTSRTTSSAAIAIAGLTEGNPLDESLLAAAEREAARERALRLVGYRERSASELTRRLHDDGYPASLTDEIVAEHVRLGLVDDQRFAHAYVRSQARAGYGRRRIERGLREKGVPAQVAQEALDAVVPVEGEPARASQAAADALRAGADRKDRVVRRLVGRGFSLGDALRAVDATEHDG